MKRIRRPSQLSESSGQIRRGPNWMAPTGLITFLFFGLVFFQNMVLVPNESFDRDGRLRMAVGLAPIDIGLQESFEFGIAGDHSQQWQLEFDDERSFYTPLLGEFAYSSVPFEVYLPVGECRVQALGRHPGNTKVEVWFQGRKLSDHVPGAQSQAVISTQRAGLYRLELRAYELVELEGIRLVGCK